MHRAALHSTYVLVRWGCGLAHAGHNNDAFGRDRGQGRSTRSIWDTLKSSESMSAEQMVCVFSRGTIHELRVRTLTWNQAHREMNCIEIHTGGTWRANPADRPEEQDPRRYLCHQAIGFSLTSTLDHLDKVRALAKRQSDLTSLVASSYLGCSRVSFAPCSLHPLVA